MSRRCAGVGLIGVAAVLYVTRYLAAALYSIGQRSSWSSEMFDAMVEYVGPRLWTWAVVALVAGVAYMVWAELTTSREGDVP